MQKYYLPKKLNVEKRASHLSSLIVSRQIFREETIEELKKSLYCESEMEQYIDQILSLIEMKREEFNTVMNTPPKQHSDYKTFYWKHVSKLARKMRRY